LNKNTAINAELYKNLRNEAIINNSLKSGIFDNGNIYNMKNNNNNININNNINNNDINNNPIDGNGIGITPTISNINTPILQSSTSSSNSINDLFNIPIKSVETKPHHVKNGSINSSSSSSIQFESSTKEGIIQELMKNIQIIRTEISQLEQQSPRNVITESLIANKKSIYKDMVGKLFTLIQSNKINSSIFNNLKKNGINIKGKKEVDDSINNKRNSFKAE